MNTRMKTIVKVISYQLKKEANHNNHTDKEGTEDNKCSKVTRKEPHGTKETNPSHLNGEERKTTN